MGQYLQYQISSVVCLLLIDLVVAYYLRNQNEKEMWFLYSRAPPRQTLDSLRSPKSHCPAVSMSLWHQMTPCSWPSLLKLRPIQTWLRSWPSRQSNPPLWRTPGCAGASAISHYRGTWTSPQDFLKSRNTSQTLCCLSSESLDFEFLWQQVGHWKFVCTANYRLLVGSLSQWWLQQNILTFLMWFLI